MRRGGHDIYRTENPPQCVTCMCNMGRPLTSVMTPSVPSDPTNRCVRSYLWQINVQERLRTEGEEAHPSLICAPPPLPHPALDFFTRRPRRVIRPSGSTTVRPITFSRIVPYRTALVPLGEKCQCMRGEVLNSL